MVARHFTELVCWQLSSELKRKIYPILARPKVAKDFRFCDQIRESARSAPRNICEGFGKYDPPEFRRYLNIAAGSISETQNHLRDALDLQYLEKQEFSELWQLSKRARGATLALMQYLEGCPRRGPRMRQPRVDPTPDHGTLNQNQPSEPTRQNPSGRTNGKNLKDRAH